jgi:hypothetical protein
LKLYIITTFLNAGLLKFVLLSVAQFNGQERAQAFVSCPPGMEWPEVMPRAHDAQLLPMDDDPSEVD